MRHLYPSCRPTVLLVADDRESRGILSELLHDEDCYIVHAGSGVQALAMLRSLRPDLVLVDLAMSFMDGPEFVRAVRRDVRFTDLPVAVLTPHADAVGGRARARTLRKPLDLPNLLDLLDAVAAVRERTSAV